MRTDNVSAVNNPYACYGTKAVTSKSSESVQGSDTVPQTGMLSKLLDGLTLPTMENARQMAEDFSQALREEMRKAGCLSVEPSFELYSDPNSLEVTVTGGRGDVSEIEKLINSKPRLQRMYNNATAIASQARAMQESMKFQQEYRASSNPAAVVAKYAHLFGPQANAGPRISMRIDEETNDLLFDGQPDETGQDVLA